MIILSLTSCDRCPFITIGLQSSKLQVKRFLNKICPQLSRVSCVFLPNWCFSSARMKLIKTIIKIQNL